MRVIPITTTDDPRVIPFRHVPDPARIRDQGICVAEGRFVVRRVLAEGTFRLQALLVTETALRALEDALVAFDDPPPVFVASRTLLREIGGYDFHQGCLGLLERPPLADAVSVIQAIEAPRPVIVLEQVGNPDNIGGIFRNAAAFGAAAVLLSPGCSDPLYRKAIRTSIGTTLSVPFAVVDEWPRGLELLRDRGYHVAALTPDPSAVPLSRYVLPTEKTSTALIVGNEGDGLSRGVLEHAHVRIRIPICPPVDSLNVSTAAGIALHALATSRVSASEPRSGESSRSDGH